MRLFLANTSANTYSISAFYYFVNYLYFRLLKACGSRLTEKLLEGAPTEDTLVLIERQTGKMNALSILINYCIKILTFYIVLCKNM